MKKSERLLRLIELLRQYRYPVSGQTLADKLGISLRTVYRDIADLKAQGADIQGEVGLGFQLKPGFLLPPLMFDSDEIEALVLGIRWIIKKTDKELQASAKSALSKIRSVIPEALQRQLDFTGLMVGPSPISCINHDDERLLRKSIQKEQKLSIEYRDVNDKQSSRILWPLGIAFFESVKVLIAWCELRQDFRHFRIDRIKHISSLSVTYPTPRHQLLHAWRKKHHIPEQ